MSPEPGLPPEFDSLLAALANQPDNVRTMWRYAMVLMLIDDERAQAVETFTEVGKTLLRVRTIAGDEFLIERPEMSAETERLLLEQVREIVEEDADTNGTILGGKVH